MAIPLIGYASGIGAGDIGCGDAAVFLQNSDLEGLLKASGLVTQWTDNFFPAPGLASYTAIADISTRLAQKTLSLAQQHQLFVVLGGDHTSAIGTWSGVAASMQNQGPLGLVWIDAHMDSHTPQTSESGNIHGMPLACLLGHGPDELTHIGFAGAKIKPEHTSLIGIHSYEDGEEKLLKRLGLTIYTMQDIQQRGLQTVMAEAIARAKNGTAGYGISFDLDSIDPQEAPGVGSPVPEGLRAPDMYAALTQVQGDKLLRGIEVVEFNPHRDQEGLTVQVVKNLLLAMLKK